MSGGLEGAEGWQVPQTEVLAVLVDEYWPERKWVESGGEGWDVFVMRDTMGGWIVEAMQLRE